MRLKQDRGRGGCGGRKGIAFACRVVLCVLGFLCVLFTSSSYAQARRDGRLLVTVVDQTGAVIPAATVSVVGQDAATRTATPVSVKTSDQGIAAIAGLALGRYAIQAEFPGFEVGSVKDVRVRTGDNKEESSISPPISTTSAGSIRSGPALPSTPDRGGRT